MGIYADEAIGVEAIGVEGLRRASWGVGIDALLLSARLLHQGSLLSITIKPGKWKKGQKRTLDGREGLYRKGGGEGER